MGTVRAELKVIGSLPYLKVSPKPNKRGGTYDRKQGYPKVAQTERSVCH
jgi:hypothetical protein